MRRLLRKRGASISSPISPEIDIDVMPSQKIHEPFVIGIRNTELWQHLLVTAACSLESLANQMFDLIPCNLPVGIGSGDRFPEVAYDHFFQRLRLARLQR